ncbi:YugN family protein [Halalkalibacillus halophilus]|uniref:YugN family protein n=1 Tax=Halalkalibacillus halophilus TaxID=392827 RepID=UPI00041AB762|nr:YugN family protein [Halalkalibacillus halophilus]
MEQLSSGIENQDYTFEPLEEVLGKFGLTIGGNWEYDHAYFDYLLDQTDEKYTHLRIPVNAEIGQIGEKDAHVRIGKPFVLSHQFEAGIDQQGDSGNFQASINQFASPVNPDAEIEARLITRAEEVLLEVEKFLLSNRF